MRIQYNEQGEQIYNRSQFAVRIGVSSQTLKFWERDERLVPASRDDKGHVFYTEAQALEYFSSRIKGKHRKNLEPKRPSAVTTPKE